MGVVSLLDGGPDLIEYLPWVTTKGEYGEDVSGFGDPIQLAVELQRLSSEETQTVRASSTAGGPTRVLYRFATRRTLPSDSHSQVRARGRLWEVVGEPTVQGRSERTRHTRVVIRALTEEADDGQ